MMYRNARNARSWAKQLALSTVCGMSLATAAHAQFSFPGFTFPGTTTPPAAAPQQQQQSAGTILTVPLTDFGQVVAQNAMRQKNVNLLHLTQVAIGDTNTQVATISIRQHNAADWTKWEPSKVCYLPTGTLNWVKQANKNTAIIEQGVVGWGNTQVAQVEVSQDNSLQVKPGTKFMMAPMSAVPSILALNQKNVNVAHISQLAVGDGNSQVALLAVDQQNAGQLQVPANTTGALVQLNLNLNIITQVAVGSGNTQVAQVSVGQSNNL
jgi:predicted amino acid-binding ACT domain protein